MHIIVLWVTVYVIHVVKLHQLLNWNEYSNRIIIEIENNQDRDIQNLSSQKWSSTSHTAYLIAVSAVYGEMDSFYVWFNTMQLSCTQHACICFYLQVIFKGLAALLTNSKKSENKVIAVKSV